MRHKIADTYRCTSPKNHFSDSHGNYSRPSGKQLPAASLKWPALPELFPGNSETIARLAQLRGLSREGISIASAKGLLRFGKYKNRSAWFIVDASGRVAQARRLDGVPWADGVKALTLAGSQAAWPVGISEAASFPAVALVEGGPDLLATCALLAIEGRQLGCAPVAMLGGCARIHADALPMFTGKRVRIFPHIDDTGDNAANRWAEQLGSPDDTTRIRTNDTNGSGGLVEQSFTDRKLENGR